MGMIPYRNTKRFIKKALKQPGYAVRVLGKRSGALLRHTLGFDPAAAPEAVTIFLTHKCNLRCVMCGQWGEGGVTRQDRSGLVNQGLSAEELRQLVLGLSAFKPAVTLFGGEPLLHPACVGLIRQIKSLGMHCVLITNGSLLPGRAEEVASSGLDELNVSLDGGSQLHDSIRGLPGVFDRIAEGIAGIQRWKKENGSARPLVNLQCTINSRNYEHLEEMIQVARDLGADSLTFHNLIFLDQAQMEKQKEIDSLLGSSSKDWNGFVSAPGIDSAALDRKISQIRAGSYPFAVDFYPNFSSCQRKAYYEDAGFIPTEYPFRCLSPWLVAYIFPDGSVRPCLNSTYSFGNVRSKPFIRLWNSPEALRFRRLLRQRKAFPACVRCTELYRY
jgi:radical SAM protein with 4Fe4S-binding SPASM domain